MTEQTKAQAKKMAQNGWEYIDECDDYIVMISPDRDRYAIIEENGTTYEDIDDEN